MILMTSPNGNIEYANEAFLEKYKYNFDEIKGKTPRVIKSGKYDRSFYKKYWDTLKSGNVMEGEMVNKAKDGEMIYVSFSSNPIIDKDEELTGFIAIQNDITDQKEAEAKLSRSLKEKEVLLSEIHPRVKNNLAIISALLELNLYQKKEDVTIEEFVRNSQFRIKAMAEVHEMLYESNEFSHISFKEYIERLIKKVQQSINLGEGKIAFETDIDNIDLNINQAIPVGLMIDELIMNAIQHGFDENGKGCVRIMLDSEGDQVVVGVQDNGTGIPSDVDLDNTNTLGMTLLKVLTQ